MKEVSDFDWLIDRAAKVYYPGRHCLALTEANRLEDTEIRPAHILLGLIAEGGGMAAGLIRCAVDNQKALRDEIERRLLREHPRTGPGYGALPLSEDALKVFEAARVECGDNTYATTEDVLLGVLSVQGSIAVEVLREFDVTLESVRRDIAEREAERV